MARRPRLVLPHVPVHIITRGNNRQPCFFTDEDFETYLQLLTEYAPKTGCAVHAYVLMTNHVHLLISPAGTDSVAQLMKAVGQRYVHYVNRAYKRTGSLWEGRFRSGLVQQEQYLLVCQRYIELNPVRAGMVTHPGEYQWSSYRANAQGEANALLKSHPLYQALGQNPAERQAAYRELFRHELTPGTVEAIREATNGNYALGDSRFAEEVAQRLGQRAHKAQAGRTKKQKEEK